MLEGGIEFDEIPDYDPRIDEFLNDPGRYAAKARETRQEEASRWVREELARVDRQYRERSLGRRVLRKIRSLRASENKAA